MRQAKHQYFRNGPENQKRADITIDMRRLDIKKFKGLTVMQRIGLITFIADSERSFKTFRKELMSLTKKSKNP